MAEILVHDQVVQDLLNNENVDVNDITNHGGTSLVLASKNDFEER